MKILLFIILIPIVFACNLELDFNQKEEVISSEALELNESAFLKYRNYVSGVNRDVRKLEEAVTELDRAIELEPKIPLFYSTKAQTLLMLGEHEEAIDVLKEVISFQPYNAEELAMIGFIYEQYENPIEARKWYERSVEAYEMRIDKDLNVINSELNLALLKFFVDNERAVVRSYYDLKEKYPDSDQVLSMEHLFTDFDRDRFFRELHE